MTLRRLSSLSPRTCATYGSSQHVEANAVRTGQTCRRSAAFYQALLNERVTECGVDGPPAWPLAVLPALARRVPHVVGMRAEEQMVWVTAGRVIAVVADVQALRNGTARQ